MPYDVFVSHSSKDKAVADAVCHSLEESGIRCWIAPRDIAAGRTWAGAIAEAIAQCRVFVLIFSAECNASEYVLREVGLALESGLPVIPFRIEDVTPTGDLKFYLKAVHWLDALTEPLKQHITRLVEQVWLLVREGPAPPPPKPSRRSHLPYTIAAVVLAVSAVAGVLLYEQSGKRSSGGNPKVGATAPSPGPEAAKSPADFRTATEPKRTADAVPEPPKSAAVLPASAAPSPSVPVAPPAPPRAGTLRVNPRDGLRYAWIPPGTFLMGCSVAGCEDKEKPSHQVRITKGYWIGQTEVTVGAFEKLVRPPEGQLGAKYPVTKVTWREAADYCADVGGRLPTEAEWEMAARAGSDQPSYGDLYRIAWYLDNAEDRPHEVGLKEPNQFGLFDMLGNVYEWVSDWYVERYEPELAVDPTGPVSGVQNRLVRGGSFGTVRGRVTASHRLQNDPESRDPLVGFRCVMPALEGGAGLR